MFFLRERERDDYVPMLAVFTFVSCFSQKEIVHVVYTHSLFCCHFEQYVPYKCTKQKALHFVATLQTRTSTAYVLCFCQCMVPCTFGMVGNL